MTTDPRLVRLAQAWDEVAADYDAYFVPRFAPWADVAVAALADLPDGLIAVPCCGTGPELVRLARRWPGRALFGVDLSPGMIARAAHAIPTARLEVGDATRTDGWGPCAAVVSVFGLQQMPDPPAAMTAWSEALTPGGLLSVVYWHEDADPDGPFGWMRSAMANKVPAKDWRWERELVPALRGEVLRDEVVAFTMEHESAAACFDAMVDCGASRPLALEKGPAFIAALREDFLALAPAGPIVHRPSARHLVARG
jgi:SAM-dependent methyltransferase